MKKSVFIALGVLVLSSAAAFSWGWWLDGERGGWIWLDRFGLFLGILAFGSVLAAVWEYFAYQRRRRRELERLRGDPGDAPAVLIVQVGRNIRPSVEKFVAGESILRECDADRHVFVVSHEGAMEAEDMDAFMAKLHREYERICDIGADKIHLFVAGPMPVAIETGQLLANRIPTIMYHHQPNQGYQNWGMLNR